MRRVATSSREPKGSGVTMTVSLAVSTAEYAFTNNRPKISVKVVRTLCEERSPVEDSCTPVDDVISVYVAARPDRARAVNVPWLKTAPRTESSATTALCRLSDLRTKLLARVSSRTLAKMAAHAVEEHACT